MEQRQRGMMGRMLMRGLVGRRTAREGNASRMLCLCDNLLDRTAMAPYDAAGIRNKVSP
jgi:hypothetical protein